MSTFSSNYGLTILPQDHKLTDYLCILVTRLLLTVLLPPATNSAVKKDDLKGVHLSGMSHLRPDLGRVSTESLQHTRCYTLTLTQQTKKDVFCANVVVPCTFGKCAETGCENTAEKTAEAAAAAAGGREGERRTASEGVTAVDRWQQYSSQQVQQQSRVQLQEQRQQGAQARNQRQGIQKQYQETASKKHQQAQQRQVETESSRPACKAHAAAAGSGIAIILFDLPDLSDTSNTSSHAEIWAVSSREELNR